MRATSIIACQLCNWRAKFTGDNAGEVIFGLAKLLNQHNIDHHLPSVEHDNAQQAAIKDSILETKKLP